MGLCPSCKSRRLCISLEAVDTRIVALIIPMLLGLCCLTGCLDPYEGGMAPSRTASEPHKWGVAELGEHLSRRRSVR